ncbi:hypothetical protein [Kineosporia sp. NBRC 101731]|uniref:amidohydrolase family protein n=1 Tax=Kineosporia sp. NBRC 101731 TaxID=3032199 RepID=UPI0024A36B6E|nr:hypothetical protein [Kineosporia sp. NBRC 101731]GLY31033.1 hypothetical protein Kisp02_43980 [Kineosporia sp. NBRC 101731]
MTVLEHVRVDAVWPAPPAGTGENAPYLGGSVLPGLVDAHVHLGLVDHARLAGSAVVEVHDLGWLPDAAPAWRATLGPSVHLEAAGPFHTAPGGYPQTRSWAPPGSVRAITNAREAETAVAALVTAGAHTLKVTLHTGGPALSDDLLHTLVRAAHAAGLTVSAHAEGEGQAQRATTAGADVLVHAPWSERLDDATIAAMAGSITWISTFAIHEGPARALALDNARRFTAAGGRLRYGTDMGNGPTPVGVNEAEILALGAAGLEGDALLGALTGVHHPDIADLTDIPATGRLLHNTRPLPRTAQDCAVWFSTAQRLTVAAAEVLSR